MIGFIKNLFGASNGEVAENDGQIKIQAYDEYNQHVFNGNKYPGGFGYQYDTELDYWSLRQKSAQLFKGNHYAAGIIDRLVNNEINTGMALEATPEPTILGIDEEFLGDWSENLENIFQIWANDPKLCDYSQRLTFNEIQKKAREEALIAGDVLVIIRSGRTGLPNIQLVRGDRVQSPLTEKPIPEGHRIVDGIELDQRNRHVRYWIQNDNLDFEGITSFGIRSKRTMSFLLYGKEPRKGEVRGMPLLSRVLQSLKEIDRYRDSAQRKAVINSFLAMYIKKTEDKMSSMPVSGGAIHKDSIQLSSQQAPRKFNLASQMPGIVYEELEVGEEPVGFHSQGTDVNFPNFEGAMLQSIGWSLGIPPEILTLSFNQNYSASQAAINEFKMYLDSVREDFSIDFCKPIYKEWFISSNLNKTVQAPGFLQAWRDPSKYLTVGAWLWSSWTGAVKPSTDMKKAAQGAEIIIDRGWSTNDKMSRELTGTKFSKNVKKLKRENEQLAEALRPMLELKQEFGPEQVEEGMTAIYDEEVN
tara:strand:- start:17376 stop:18962 length:1587 start_codon:yes stop_codon:yes gene_type:complete